MHHLSPTDLDWHAGCDATRNRFTSIGGARWSSCVTPRVPIQISKVQNQSCVWQGQPHGTVRSVGPVRGGAGYRWLVTPEGLNHISRGLGWTIWEATNNECTLFYQQII